MVDPARAHSTGPVGGSDLAGRNLARVSHSGDNLQQADLREATMPWSFLKQTRLVEANLRQANLVHADLTGANLWGACLISADLTAANLTGTNPMAARSLQGARLDGDIGLSANDRTLCEDLAGHRRLAGPARLPRSPP